MKHVLFGQKAIFLGDEATDALITYAGHMAQIQSGDSVDMRGVNADGNIVVTTFLLNSGTNVTAETTDLHFEEPDNDEAIAYIRQRTDLLSQEPLFAEGFRARDEMDVP